MKNIFQGANIKQNHNNYQVYKCLLSNYDFQRIKKLISVSIRFAENNNSITEYDQIEFCVFLHFIIIKIDIKMAINKVILAGNVGKDPIIRYFDKGTVKASFPLATGESYTNQKGELIRTTEWHNIVLWGVLAEIVEKTIKKGSFVYLTGKIQTRTYIDKDGVNKYITEIVGDSIMELKRTSQPSYPKPDDNNSQNVPPTNGPTPSTGDSISGEDNTVPPSSDDDLPF